MTKDDLKYKKEVMDAEINRAIKSFYDETGIQVTETVIQWTKIAPTSKCMIDKVAKTIVSVSVKTEIRL